MYKQSLEAFINFCDNMMIAEEGIMSGIFAAIKDICKANKSVKKEDNKKTKINFINKGNRKTKDPRTVYVNKGFIDVYKYNGYNLNEVDWRGFKYEPMTSEQEARCASAVAEYKEFVKKFKDVVARANKIAGGNYFSFINESLTKFEMVYDENKNQVSISGYPIGYKYFEEGWKNEELCARIENAWGIMDKDIKNVAGKHDTQMCKLNCDGFPEYCNDYHRFYWFNMIINL